MGKCLNFSMQPSKPFHVTHIVVKVIDLWSLLLLCTLSRASSKTFWLKMPQLKKLDMIEKQEFIFDLGV